jgi:hypothetical protein
VTEKMQRKHSEGDEQGEKPSNSENGEPAWAENLVKVRLGLVEEPNQDDSRDAK